MVTTEPRGDQKPKEEVDVWVVTRGGIQMGMDLEHGEILVRTSKGRSEKWHRTS
jgi:hypothetical protein